MQIFLFNGIRLALPN